MPKCTFNALNMLGDVMSTRLICFVNKITVFNIYFRPLFSDKKTLVYVTVQVFYSEGHHRKLCFLFGVT